MGQAGLPRAAALGGSVRLLRRLIFRRRAKTRAERIEAACCSSLSEL